MIGHFQTLLAGIATNLQQYISQLSLLSADEEEQLTLLENHQKIDSINYKCIHILFEEQVEKSPDAIAVVYVKQDLTYRELNKRANQLAHYLKSLGVKPEVKVGICVERSLEMLVGILAILKAGGAYVPIDPAYPTERLALMLEDVQAPILLTQTNLQNRLPLNNQTVVNLDSDWETISQYQEDNLPSEVNPENLAYIIYTSGSTGTPKGTEVPHRSILGFMFGVDYIHLDANQIWLQHSSISWDGLTLELWSPLLYGGRCVLFPEKIPTPESLSQIVQEQRVNTLFLTTALFNLMIDTMPQGLSEIKQLMFGGESVSVPHVRRALELLPETKTIHVYGPSECTVFTSAYPIPKQLVQNICSIPIGKPIGDRTVYLLDENLHRVPIGVAGELYVGGASVARGYLNQPNLTREKFIHNPFIEGDTLYKTGDLVRRLPDGNLEFIGRIDTQVKIRGFRIELAEIEAILIQHPDIKQVVVIAREDEPGKKLLVAYLVAKDNPPTPSNLRNFLNKKLPDYMIPAAFVFLEGFPLTPNGKINRRALPVPDTDQRNLEVDFVLPCTPIEQELATIWAEVLKLKQVGIHDNFFELGGHSLLATQVISRLRETFYLDFPLRYLFENTTIAELAQKVSEQQIEQAENDALAKILEEVDKLSEEEVTQQLLL
jgi:amino acid adenylation domain-containing protein